MPIYEYECAQCMKRFEELQRFDDPAPSCPECGGTTRRLLSAPVLHGASQPARAAAGDAGGCDGACACAAGRHSH